MEKKNLLIILTATIGILTAITEALRHFWD